ncbi:MAG TPA: 3-hydroxyacyl-CoA dehydrogenase family protein [Chloroflexota bacterium]
MARNEQIAIVGAGLMGHALALDFALRSQDVVITDAEPGRLADLGARLRTDLQPFLQAGMLDAATAGAVIERIRPVEVIAQAVGDATYVVEAITENLAAKQALYTRLEALAPVDAIFASNTSGLRATDLSAGLEYPERLIVAHYFNPPYLLPPVEIVPGVRTSPETVAATCALLEGIGKKPVVLRREIPGFIANRLQAALLREAIHLVSSGVCRVEDIDAIMSGAVGRRLTVMGPFQVLDFAGVDVWAQIGEYLFADLDRSDDAAAHLRDLAQSGRTGVKAGAGIYTWSPEAIAQMTTRRDRELMHCLQRDAAPDGAAKGAD